MSAIKSFRAKIQTDFSDSDVENFDDCDPKRSTFSNADQIDTDTRAIETGMYSLIDRGCKK
jgi:hypothetical protein